MNVIGHHMSLFYQALLLPGQSVKNICQFPSNLTEECFPPIFGYKHYVVLTLPSGVI
jgi:hypothetical protein